MTQGTVGLGPARDELLRLARGEHHDPHAILGAHPLGDGTVIRAFHPDATGVDLVAPNGGTQTMEPLGEGLWAGIVPSLAPTRVPLPDPLLVRRRQHLGA